MVRLFHINIPKAVNLAVKMAAKIEAQAEKEFRGDHKRMLLSLAQEHYSIAEKLEAGKYASFDACQALIKTHSYLRECVL